MIVAVPLAAVVAAYLLGGPEALFHMTAAREIDSTGGGARRQGAVDLNAEFDLEGLTIPRNEIHTLLQRDAIPALIPALTDPRTELAADASWLAPDDPVVEVSLGGETFGVPLRVLDWHEIVNTTVSGEPIVVSYCPLCDSATVFSRRVTRVGPDGVSSTDVLEFGVSGALYNSNVLMYDRTDDAFWSQLGMRAVSGPLAGTALDMLPVRVVPFSEFKGARGARIVSKDTGYQRDYSGSPYASYFATDELRVPVEGVGDALPRKTPGIGVVEGVDSDARAWFVPLEAVSSGCVLETRLGPVSLTSSEAGVAVQSMPEGIRTARAFYYSWSAFYPQTSVYWCGRAAPVEAASPGESRQSDGRPDAAHSPPSEPQ